MVVFPAEMADEALFQFLHNELIQYVNNAESGENVRYNII